jgi:hypothetical protein
MTTGFAWHVRTLLVEGQYIMPDDLYFTKGFSFKPSFFSLDYNGRGKDRWCLSLRLDFFGLGFYRPVLERDGIEVPLTKEERKFLSSVYWSCFDHCKDDFEQRRQKSRRWP